MNYSKLQDEVLNDPGGVGYSGMTDAAVLAAMYVEDIPVVDTSRKTFRDLIALTDLTTASGIIAAMKAAAASNPALLVAVKACEDYAENGGLDFSHPKTIEALDALEAQSILSTDQVNLLKSMGKKMASRVDIRGLGRVRKGDLARVRAG